MSTLVSYQSIRKRSTFKCSRCRARRLNKSAEERSEVSKRSERPTC